MKYFRRFFAEKMKDPEVRREYEALEDEFAGYQAQIDEAKRAPMASPDEIKKALACYGFGCTDGCDDCDICPLNTDYMGHESLMQDALEYIEQLEQRDVERAVRLVDVIEMSAKLKRERDAAVADMERAQCLTCQVCKNYYQPDPNVRKWACRIFGHWDEVPDVENLWCGSFEWRGVQEE